MVSAEADLRGPAGGTGAPKTRARQGGGLSLGRCRKHLVLEDCSASSLRPEPSARCTLMRRPATPRTWSNLHCVSMRSARSTRYRQQTCCPGKRHSLPQKSAIRQLKSEMPRDLGLAHKGVGPRIEAIRRDSVVVSATENDYRNQIQERVGAIQKKIEAPTPPGFLPCARRPLQADPGESHRHSKF